MPLIIGTTFSRYLHRRYITDAFQQQDIAKKTCQFFKVFLPR
jgi:hypothetical protein